MITIYGTPHCLECRRVKKQLESMGLEYISVDVTGKDELVKELAEVSGKMSLPIIKNEDKFIEIEDLTQ